MDLHPLFLPKHRWPPRKKGQLYEQVVPFYFARSGSFLLCAQHHRRAPWKTKESVELATLEWVAWFNNHRLMEPLGYIPPAEAEANYYRQLASQTAMPV